MHLYALDINDEVIHAGHANKHINYTCLECTQTVRLRSGFHRQPHFYHLLSNHKCRLNGKSMPHLMLQQHLECILPKGEVQLEYRFPAISRIADVAWLNKKIIFEVQCSSISAAEILQRNSDYATQGYQVVWILHQNRYNQQRVTAAENALQNCPHYFCDMDGEGKGEIFDQLSFIVQGMRKQRLPKKQINVSQPFHEIPPAYLNFPQIIRQRMKAWPLHFQGDYINLCHASGNDAFIDGIHQAEVKWTPVSNEENILDLSISTFFKKFCLDYILFPYHSILRILLERASR